MPDNIVWVTTLEQWEALTPNEQWQQYQRAFNFGSEYSKKYIQSLPQLVVSAPTWLDRLFGRDVHIQVIEPAKQEAVRNDR